MQGDAKITGLKAEHDVCKPSAGSEKEHDGCRTSAGYENGKYFCKACTSGKKSYSTLWIAVLILLLLISFAASLFFGAQKINLPDLFVNGTNFSKKIFFNIRLPRSLLVCIAGIMLAGSGAVFQMFFRNPLAEPGIMGISAGATLGAVIAAVFAGGFTLFGRLSFINIGAFSGAVLSGIIVTLLAFRKGGGSSTTVLLLCGTALGTLYSAITSIILTINDKQLHAMYNWMLGSFSGRGWSELYFILVPGLIAFVLLLLTGGRLDLLSGGEDTALSLGVNVSRLRAVVIIAGSLAVSAAVCAGGTIGFVGLIAPHVMRSITGAKGKTLVPFSMIAGAVLLLAADTLCRTVVAPAGIVVGTVTSLLGVPFFIALVFSKRGLRNGR